MKALITGASSGIGRDMARKLSKEGYNLILATNPIFPRIATLNRIKWAGLDPDDFIYISTYENSHYSKPNIKYYEEIMKQKEAAKAEETKVEEACVVETTEVEETKAEVDSTVIIEGHEGDSYEATSKMFEGYDLREDMLPENTKGVMTKGDIIINYYYSYKTTLLSYYKQLYQISNKKSLF